MESQVCSSDDIMRSVDAFLLDLAICRPQTCGVDEADRHAVENYSFLNRIAGGTGHIRYDCPVFAQQAIQ